MRSPWRPNRLSGLIAVLVVVGLVLPAGAKPDKPGKPEQTPDLYEVTMTLVEGEAGLATDCGPLVMEAAKGKGAALRLKSLNTEHKALWVRAPNVA